jgi:DNA-binding CsgD family transcriptional regulator
VHIVAVADWTADQAGLREPDTAATDRQPSPKQEGPTEMPHIDIEILAPFGAKFMEGTNLTPAERAEVLRIAQGFACKDSAAAAGVSPETIRARRKRIYRKTDVAGSGELIASLLALSLSMLAKGEKIEARPAAATQPQQPGASSSLIAVS